MSLEKYCLEFSLIELQSTFYKLPETETAERWRDKVHEEFEFSLKAFQGITHPISSPTWRKAGKQKPTEKLDNYGHLKPTKENFDSWEKTMKIYKLLKARALVVQLPPSFQLSNESLRNTKDFFSSVKKPELLCIEFRHKSWFQNLDKTRELLESINAIHITDPLLMKPLTLGKISYSRLHGLGKKAYKYKYKDDELRRIKLVLDNLGFKKSYILFNNIYMREDAKKFEKVIY